MWSVVQIWANFVELVYESSYYPGNKNRTIICNLFIESEVSVSISESILTFDDSKNLIWIGRVCSWYGYKGTNCNVRRWYNPAWSLSCVLCVDCWIQGFWIDLCLLAWSIEIFKKLRPPRVLCHSLVGSDLPVMLQSKVGYVIAWLIGESVRYYLLQAWVCGWCMNPDHIWKIALKYFFSCKETKIEASFKQV